MSKVNTVTDKKSNLTKDKKDTKLKKNDRRYPNGKQNKNGL